MDRQWSRGGCRDQVDDTGVDVSWLEAQYRWARCVARLGTMDTAPVARHAVQTDPGSHGGLSGAAAPGRRFFVSTPVDTAQALTEAFNARDWGAFRDLIADECVYEEPATGLRATRGDDWLTAVRATAAAFDDLQGEVTNAFGAGNQIALEITWRGTHTGDFDLPGGAIPATGRHIESKAVQIAEVVDGRVTVNRHYFDVATTLSQLGLLPPSS